MPSRPAPRARQQRAPEARPRVGQVATHLQPGRRRVHGEGEMRCELHRSVSSEVGPPGLQSACQRDSPSKAERLYAAHRGRRLRRARGTLQTQRHRGARAPAQAVGVGRSRLVRPMPTRLSRRRSEASPGARRGAAKPAAFQQAALTRTSAPWAARRGRSEQRRRHALVELAAQQRRGMAPGTPPITRPSRRWMSPTGRGPRPSCRRCAHDTRASCIS